MPQFSEKAERTDSPGLCYRNSVFLYPVRLHVYCLQLVYTLLDVVAAELYPDLATGEISPQ